MERRIGDKEMSIWKECKLGDVVISNAKSITTEYPYKTIQYLDTGSITCGKLDSYQEYLLKKAPSRARRLVKENDIVYSSVRPIQRHYGYIVNPPENLVVSTGFSVIETNKEKADPKFIYYFLTSDEIVEGLEIIADASTTTYPSLKPSDIERLDILLPPLPEQRAIAGVLSSLDDKIDLLHRQNKTLEGIAESLWRKMFVEDADSNWKQGKLGDEMTIIMGQSPEGNTYNEEKQGMVFFQGRAEFDFRFPQTRLFCTEPKRLAKKGDTLVSVRAPVGDINIAYEDCCIGRGLAAVRQKCNYLSYTFYKIRSLKDEFDSFEQQGTVFGSIVKDDFNNIETFIPLETTIQEFESIAKPLDDKVLINSTQIRTLSHLRNTLLPKLMCGEVMVKYE